MLNASQMRKNSRLPAAFQSASYAIWSAALGLALLAAPSMALAQAKPGEKPPAPEDMTLTTKDGVLLRCTFYGSNKKKEAVPIILLHGWEGRRSDYDGFATALQGVGHAVIAPDLRGHGDSTERRSRPGETTEIDSPDEMRKADVAGTLLDVEACKKYLLEQNDEGNLNIEMLTVIGADVSALIALDWAALDWMAPRLPTIKQGQDVKALVLISPEQSFRGLTTRRALAQPNIRKDVSVMVLVGKNDRNAYSDAKRIHSSLSRFREPPPTDPMEIKEKQDLFLHEFDTSLQGVKLLDQRSLRAPGFIGRFIQWRVVDNSDKFVWMQRKRS